MDIQWEYDGISYEVECEMVASGQVSYEQDGSGQGVCSVDCYPLWEFPTILLSDTGEYIDKMPPEVEEEITWQLWEVWLDEQRELNSSDWG